MQDTCMVKASNMHCSLYLLITYLCVHTCITWKLQVIYQCPAYWMSALLLESFLVWFRVVWEIWLESYSHRHVSVVLRYNIVCVYCKPFHTSLFGVQLHMTTQLKQFYDCTSHQTTALLLMMHCFIRTKLASYTICCSVFSINCVR